VVAAQIKNLPRAAPRVFGGIPARGGRHRRPVHRATGTVSLSGVITTPGLEAGIAAPDG